MIDIMRKQKTEKELIYEGLGFPVVLKNVPMIEVRGKWTLNIHLNVLQKMVLLSLAHHPYDLTGNQIRFIRNWLELTQSAFGKLFGVTHPAVVKWEKTENQGSKMNLTTQRDLRLWLLDKLLKEDDEFRKAFKVVHMTIFSSNPQLLEFDASTDLEAV